jgi:NAD(P)-dependent dehydrogenase (short-subunit alcohol dehydrogenase family)
MAVWRQVIDVNLVAAALLTKAVLPSMMANRSGKIINMSSIGGRKGGKGRSAYRITKAGLISLTESVAAEVKPFNIDVVCICPCPSRLFITVEIFDFCVSPPHSCVVRCCSSLTSPYEDMFHATHLLSAAHLRRLAGAPPRFRAPGKHRLAASVR